MCADIKLCIILSIVYSSVLIRSSSQPFSDSKQVPALTPYRMQQLYEDDFCLSNRSEVSSEVDETV